jgi:hypothetical protein
MRMYVNRKELGENSRKGRKRVESGEAQKEPAPVITTQHSSVYTNC